MTNVVPMVAYQATDALAYQHTLPFGVARLAGTNEPMSHVVPFGVSHMDPEGMVEAIAHAKANGYPVPLGALIDGWYGPATHAWFAQYLPQGGTVMAITDNLTTPMSLNTNEALVAYLTKCGCELRHNFIGHHGPYLRAMVAAGDRPFMWFTEHYAEGTEAGTSMLLVADQDVAWWADMYAVGRVATELYAQYWGVVLWQLLRA